MALQPKACSVCAVRETALCRVLDTQQLRASIAGPIGACIRLGS